MKGNFIEIGGRKRTICLVNEPSRLFSQWLNVDQRLIRSSSYQLWSLIPQEKRDQYIADGKNGDTAPVLDLLPLGYSKVLGKGRLPEVPLVVRARYFSKEAERKIKEVGGVVELVA